jgi:hypothetical protein
VPLPLDVYDYSAVASAGVVTEYIIADTKPLPKEFSSYYAAGAFEMRKEDYMQ